MTYCIKNKDMFVWVNQTDAKKTRETVQRLSVAQQEAWKHIHPSIQPVAPWLEGKVAMTASWPQEPN